MKDFLQDVIAHTHALGFIQLVKLTTDDITTKITSLSEDKSVVLQAKTFSPISSIIGTFGLPNLNKLDHHLKCPEYKKDAIISLEREERNGEEKITGLLFKNSNGDYENSYRFMAVEIINTKLKTLKFNEPPWDISFSPTAENIQRLKYQASAHSEELFFQFQSKNNDLICKFGDINTHAGNFIFHHGINKHLKSISSWPIKQFMSILSLPDKIEIKISDKGSAIMQITTISKFAEYKYILRSKTN